MKMKSVIIRLSFLFLFIFIGILPVTGTTPVAQKENGENSAKNTQQPSWEIPIAAGIWYPTDGPVPEKPMRYYRVRCWPGCHIGSSYGKYPDKTLKDKPIWPTTTIDVHSTESSDRP